MASWIRTVGEWLAANSTGLLALAVSLVALVYSRRSTAVAERTEKRLDPVVIGRVGMSARGLRIFSEITYPIDEASRSTGTLGLLLRNDGQRAVDVTSIICYVSSPGSHPPTLYGVWPTGPELPCEITTGEALWEIPLAEVAYLGNVAGDRDDEVDVRFRLTLSTGRTQDIGPVLLRFSAS